MSTSRKELDKGRTLESNYANRGKKWLSLEEFSLFYAWLLASPAGPREASEPKGKGKRHVFNDSVISYLTAKWKIWFEYHCHLKSNNVEKSKVSNFRIFGYQKRKFP